MRRDARRQHIYYERDFSQSERARVGGLCKVSLPTVLVRRQPFISPVGQGCRMRCQLHVDLNSHYRDSRIHRQNAVARQRRSRILGSRRSGEPAPLFAPSWDRHHCWCLCQLAHCPRSKGVPLGSAKQGRCQQPTDSTYYAQPDSNPETFESDPSHTHIRFVHLQRTGYILPSTRAPKMGTGFRET